jgi:transcriptional regulator with XRE-family HTH domain
MATVEHKNKELGARIRSAAEQAGLTLQQLGQKIGVSRPTIYAYAAGTLNVSTERLKQIAEATNQSTSHFTVTSSAPGPVRPLEELVDALLGRADLQRAVKVVHETLENAERSGRQAELASIQHKLGNALLLDGNYLEAAGHLQSARQGFLSQSMPSKAASCSQSLGYAYINTGRLERARRCFDDALENLTPDRRWMAEVSLAALAERSGDIREASDRLKDLSERRGLSESAKRYILSNQASLAATCGHWIDSERLNRLALDTSGSVSSDQVTERFLQIGRALVRQMRLEEGSLWLMRAMDAAHLSGDTARMAFIGLVIARLLLTCGELSEARALAVRWQSDAIRNEHRRSESYALLLLSEIAFARGDFEVAADYGRQAASFCDAHQYPFRALGARAVVASSLARTGNLAGARAELSRADDTAGKDELGVQRAMLLSARALIAAAEGDEAQSIARSQGAITTSREAGDALMAAAENHRLCDAIARRGGDARAANLAESEFLNDWMAQKVHILKEDGIKSQTMKTPHWRAFSNP